jgi:hypothetical protein
MKDVLYRVGVGMRLVRASKGVWGTPAFWDTIGWWHNEVHYVIPRIREEKRVAAELELAFGAAVPPVGVTSSTGVGMSSISVTPHISPGNSKVEFKNQRVVINPGKLSVGQWQWESLGVRTQGVPTPLRRLLIRVLVGAEWVPDEGSKKPRAPSGPEYDRLPWGCSPPPLVLPHDAVDRHNGDHPVH